MSTETWIALSVVFSLVLAGVGWMVQFRLNRDIQQRAGQERTLEDSLQAAVRELGTVRDTFRAGELVAMILALAWPGDRSEVEIDAIATGVKTRLGMLPSKDELRDRLDKIESSLATIASGIDRLTCTDLVPTPRRSFED